MLMICINFYVNAIRMRRAVRYRYALYHTQCNDTPIEVCALHEGEHENALSSDTVWFHMYAVLFHSICVFSLPSTPTVPSGSIGGTVMLVTLNTVTSPL